jgi:hypothetical protein
MKTRLILLFALFLPSIAFAYGDCYRDCMDASGCWSARSDENVSYCSGVQATCSSRCRDEGPGGGGQVYGAIAYSKKKGVYGYSYGWNSQKKAEAVALKNCKDSGPGCKSVVWFYNSCAAVASDGPHVTWGQADTASAAIKDAVDKCNKTLFHGKCENKVYSCSGV